MIIYILCAIWYVVGYVGQVIWWTEGENVTVGMGLAFLAGAVVGPVWLLIWLIEDKQIMGKVLISKKGTK